MRFKVIFFVVSFVCLSGAAQENYLNRGIEISSVDPSAISLIERIAEETPLQFSYNPEVIDLKKRVNLPAVGKLKCQDLMTLIAAAAGFEYKVIENQVSLKPSKKKTAYHTISGFLRDSDTSEDLIGAVVKIDGTNTGGLSNTYGFYSITLPLGVYQLKASYIGYTTKEIEVVVLGDVKKDIVMKTQAEKLTEIVIYDDETEESVSTAYAGVSNMSPKEVKLAPALFGEPDVLRSIKSLPGVQSTTELSANFTVRGGNFDQNLILLDEAIVYNPSHMLGLFSTFNNDAVKDIRFYKGVMPAKYGGRLSSVVDVSMKDGSKKEFGIQGGISLLSSKLTMELPFGNERGSLMLSGRRSYLDIITRLIDSDIPFFYFFDFNGKVNYRINDRNSIYLSSYTGRDVFRSFVSFDNTDGEFNWGNGTFTARWNHLFSEKLFSNFSVVQSSYNYQTNFSEFVDSLFWRSSLENVAVKADFEYYANPESLIGFGYQAIAHGFSPGNIDGRDGREPIVSIPGANGLEHAMYLNHDYDFGNGFSLVYGVRSSAFHSAVSPATDMDSLRRKTYFRVSPKLGLSYKLNDHSHAKFGYNRAVQYIHLASNTLSGTPLDVWFPSSATIKPQRGDLFSLGYYSRSKNRKYQFSSEVYYRFLRNQVDFADGADLFQNTDVIDELRFGNGRSYGWEVQVRKPIGKFSGWLNYSLSHSSRRMMGINGGRRFRSNFDRPHSISAAMNFKASSKYTFSLSWNFASGAPVTVPQGQYLFRGKAVPYFGERNTVRAPDYHRLDLSVDINLRNRKPQKRLQQSLNISIYNLYNRVNSTSYYFTSEGVNSGESPTQLTGRVEKVTLFPFFPSIAWNFSF